MTTVTAQALQKLGCKGESHRKECSMIGYLYDVTYLSVHPSVTLCIVVK